MVIFYEGIVYNKRKTFVRQEKLGVHEKHTYKNRVEQILKVMEQ